MIVVVIELFHHSFVLSLHIDSCNLVQQSKVNKKSDQTLMSLIEAYGIEWFLSLETYSLYYKPNVTRTQIGDESLSDEDLQLLSTMV